MQTPIKTPEIQAQMARTRFDNMITKFKKTGDVSVKIDNAF